jgi:WD40 repeat protein
MVPSEDAMRRTFAHRIFHPTDLSGVVIRAARSTLCALTIFLSVNAQAAERVPLAGHTQPIVAIAFSGDGKLLATGSHDHSLRVWDLNGRKQQQVHAYAGIPSSLQFNADGTTLIVREQLTTGSDVLSFLDIATGGETHRLLGRQNQRLVRGLSPDSRWMIAAESKAARLELWDVSSGQMVGYLAGSANSSVLAFSGDSRRFVVSASPAREDAPLRQIRRGPPNCQVLVWNAKEWNSSADGGLTPQAPFAKFNGPRQSGEIARVDALVLSPDGRRLAVSGPEFRGRYPDECPGRVVVLDIETGVEIFNSGAAFDGEVHDLAFSTDQKMLVASVDESGITYDMHQYRKMVVWNIATGARVAEEPSRGIVAPVISPNGNLLAAKRLVYQLENRQIATSANDPGELCVWERADENQPFRLRTAENEFPIREFSPQANGLAALVFTPDGRWLVVAAPMKKAGNSSAVDYLNLIDVSNGKE